MIRTGKEGCKCGRDRVNAGGRDLIGRTDATGLTCGQGGQMTYVGEIAALHPVRRHHGGNRHIFGATQTLVVTKKEGMVTKNRAADCSAKLVLAEDAFADTFLPVEVRIRIERA